MKMHMVHEATDVTEQRMRLLLISLSHFSYLLKLRLCFVGVKDGMSFICVYANNLETLTVCMSHCYHLLYSL